MGTVTLISPTADAEIGDTTIIIDAHPDPEETPEQVRLTIEEISSPEHSTQPWVGAWGPFTNQIPWSPPGTGFTHRPQQHRITVEVQFRKNYPPPPSASIASDSVLVWVITTIVRDVTPEYLLWNPDGGQPLQITWTLEHAAPISSPPLRKRVRIFDLSGQRVRSLYYDPQVDPDNEFTDTAPGSQVEIWDGKGDPDPRQDQTSRTGRGCSMSE
jgi:hypothetical protein